MTTKAKRRRNRKSSSLRQSAGRELSDRNVGVFTSANEDAVQLKTVEELHAWLESKGANRGGLDIRGRVGAQVGVFKDGRGEFDFESLEQLAVLANAVKGGLRSYFKHESLSNDNLGRLVGKDRDFYIDESGQIPKLRSEHFVLESVAMDPPPDGGGKPYGEYVAELAISDPSAFSSSLALSYKPELRLDEKGEREREADGSLKPAIWRPTRLYSLDVVSTGAACDDFLGFDDGDEKLVAKASELVSQFFDREEITPDAMRDRLSGFSEKIVLNYFEDVMSTDEKNPQMDDLLKSQSDINEKFGALNDNIGKLLEKLTPAPAPPSDEKDDGLSAQDSKKIVDLCAQQGLPDMAAALLSEDGMNVDLAKDKLLAASKKDRQLDDNDNDGQGGNPTSKDGKLSAEKLEAKLREEYQKDADVHERCGLSFEDFKTDRSIELGYMDEPSGNLSGRFVKGALMLLLLIGATVSMIAFGNSEVAMMAMLVGPVGMAVAVNQVMGRDGKSRRVRRKVKGSNIIYSGTFTFLDADGFLRAAYVASSTFGGIAYDKADATGLADGALATETVMDGLFTPIGATHSLVQADVGNLVYASDNFTLSNASGSNVAVGTLQDIDEKGRPVINLLDR